MEGEYEIPGLDIGTAKAIAYIIDDRFDGIITYEDSEADLAEALDHETYESGAFRSKLTDLKTYGLLEGRKERTLTPLADTFLKSEDDAISKIIDEVELFKQAKMKFGQDVPSVSDWKHFLNDLDISWSDRKVRTTWKRYISLVRNLPTDAERDDAESLDVERDFRYYFNKLDHSGTRDAAFRALSKNFKRKKLPDGDSKELDIDPLGEILEKIEDPGPKDKKEDYYRLLRIICENNELEEDIHGEINELLYETLSEISKGENVEEDVNRNIAKYCKDTLETLKPEQAPQRVLDLGLNRLEEGAKSENPMMREFAKMNLIRWVMVDAFRERFFDELIDETESYVWMRKEETENEALNEEYDDLLKFMNVI